MLARVYARTAFAMKIKAFNLSARQRHSSARLLDKAGMPGAVSPNVRQRTHHTK
jgi:hypothetical protein